MNHSLESCIEHTVKSADDTKSRYFCGEVVVAGANPGVLISRTRVWRDGKEMVTEVPGLFPPGVVSHLTPATAHRQGMGGPVQRHHAHLRAGGQAGAEGTEHHCGPWEGEYGPGTDQGAGQATPVRHQPQ